MMRDAAQVHFADGFDEPETIAFGLTAPQLGVVAIGALCAWLLLRLPMPAAVDDAAAVLVAGCAAALGFGRLAGRPALTWAWLGVLFMLRPHHGGGAATRSGVVLHAVDSDGASPTVTPWHRPPPAAADGDAPNTPRPLTEIDEPDGPDDGDPVDDDDAPEPQPPWARWLSPEAEADPRGAPAPLSSATEHHPIDAQTTCRREDAASPGGPPPPLMASPPAPSPPPAVPSPPGQAVGRTMSAGPSPDAPTPTEEPRTTPEPTPPARPRASGLGAALRGWGSRMRSAGGSAGPPSSPVVDPPHPSRPSGAGPRARLESTSAAGDPERTSLVLLPDTESPSRMPHPPARRSDPVSAADDEGPGAEPEEPEETVIPLRRQVLDEELLLELADEGVLATVPRPSRRPVLPPDGPPRPTPAPVGDAPVFVGATRRIAFYSLNGGTGRTMLATEIACILTARGRHRERPDDAPRPLRVALVDLDLRSANVAVRLGIPQPTLWDYLLDAGDDVTSLERYLVTHSSGVRALLGPPKPLSAGSTALEPARVAEIVHQLERSGRHFIVFDVAADLSAVTTWVLSNVHDIYVVITPTASGIQDAYRSTETLRRLGLGNKLRYVVNRSRGSLDLDEVMGDLDGRVVASIPWDPRVEDAENRHRLVSLDGRGPAADALHQLAATIYPGLLPARRRGRLAGLLRRHVG